MSFGRKIDSPEGKSENTVLLVFAAIGSFGWALVMAAIVILQVGVGAATGQNDVAALGYWNFIAVIFYVVIGAGILLRKKWAWGWGIGTNIINVLFGTVQLFDGGLLNILLIPIEVLIAIALYFTRPSRSLSEEYGGRAFIPVQEEHHLAAKQALNPSGAIADTAASAPVSAIGIWNCSKQHSNPNSSSFCVQCGEAYERPQAKCPSCGAVAEIVTAFCGSCGQPMGQKPLSSSVPVQVVDSTRTEPMSPSTMMYQESSGLGWPGALGASLVSVALLLTAYFSPWICLYNLRAALLSGDASAIDRYVDFVSLRSNIKDKANRYIETLSKGENTLVRMYAGLVVDQYLNPVVMEKVVNPETAALLFRNESELSLLKPITEKLRNALRSESLNTETTVEYNGFSTFILSTHVPEADSEQLCRCRMTLEIIFKRKMVVLWELTDIVLRTGETRAESASNSSNLPKTSPLDTNEPSKNGTSLESSPDSGDMKTMGASASAQVEGGNDNQSGGSALAPAQSAHRSDLSILDEDAVKNAVSFALRRYSEGGISGLLAEVSSCYESLEKASSPSTSSSDSVYKHFERCLSMDLAGHHISRRLGAHEFFTRALVMGRAHSSKVVSGDAGRIERVEKVVAAALGANP